MRPPSAATIGRAASRCSRTATRRPRLVLAHQARVADDVDRHDRGEAAGRGHCSGTPALRRPSRTGSSWARYVGSSLIAVQSGAGAGDGEGRVERETGLDRGTRLVQSTQLRERGGQLKIRCAEISVGLDRPSKPRDRLLLKAEVVLRDARGSSSKYKPTYRAD